MLGYTHAPENHARLGCRKGARHVAQHLRRNTANLGHFLRRETRKMRFFRLPVFGVGVNILLIVEPFFHNYVHDCVQHRHICPRSELQHMRCETLQRLPAWIHDDQFATALCKLLEVGCCDGMVLNRVCTDHDSHIRVLNLVEGRCDSTRAHVFHQRSHGRCVAQARAVVDIVVTEPLTDHLLKKIGFFIGAFRRTKPGNFTTAPLHSIGSKIERFVPACFAEMRTPVRWVHV